MYTSGGLTFIAIFFWISLGGILYTYFGYPLLITLLARLRPKTEIRQTNNPPNATLLVAAHTEEAVIAEKIKNCLLNYPKERLQILIVTDGSTDSTPEIVKKYAKDGVELLHQPERRGKMAAINRAMPHARGEIIVFSDANNHYHPDAIAKLVAPFSDPHIGAVSGAKTIEQEGSNLGVSEGLYWKYESFIKTQENRVGNCTSVCGEILAIRKDAYTPPPENTINDDFYIAMQIVRQGYRLVYAPEAKSTERVSATARDEITRRTRINAGRYQAIALASQLLPFNRPLLVWQIVSHKFLRPLVPLGMIAVALSNVILVLAQPQSRGIARLFYLGTPYGEIMLGLQMLFYLLAWLGARFPNQNKRSKLTRLLYLPTFLANSNLAAFKGLIQFLRGQQSHIWERIPRR
ncbi:MAG: glycosyltransferase family 2 protein [Chloroflexi bacterium]|nr:glycosyltransferase family 2 protein [Chloroflexota bacterium]